MNPEKEPPIASGEECVCSRGNPRADCTLCAATLSAYWCDVCQREVPEKRCPLCGLKARKMRRKQDKATS